MCSLFVHKSQKNTADCYGGIFLWFKQQLTGLEGGGASVRHEQGMPACRSIPQPWRTRAQPEVERAVCVTEFTGLEGARVCYADSHGVASEYAHT